MKNFFLKVLIFSGLLFLFQIVLSIIYPPEIPEKILHLDHLLEQKTDIIYLGDSTLIHPQGEPTTVEILQEMLSDQSIGEVAHPAYNLDLYLHYVDYIVQHPHDPKRVIIPINMRSFSPEWDMRPGYQFEAEKAVLNYGIPLSTLFYRPLDIFGAFDPPINQETFLNTEVYKGETIVGTVADFESSNPELSPNDDDFAYYATLPSSDQEEELEDKLVYYYMYSLSSNHRKVEAMLEAGRRLTANNIDVLFYITPINYQMGQRYVGETFRQQVTENTGRVTAWLQAEDFPVLDLTFDLDAYTFVDTEHLQETGKRYVAEQLALTLTETSESVPITQKSSESSFTSPTATPTRQITPTPTPIPTEIPPTPTRRTRRATPTSPRIIRASTPTPIPPTPTPIPKVRATITKIQPLPTATPQNEQVGKILAAEYLNSAQPAGNYTVDVYRIRFQSLDQENRLVEIQANLYLPNAEAEFPILVYGPGTTGLDNQCAPLMEQLKNRNWGLYHNHMLQYAAQGFIGLLPNWQGFNEADRIHPYFIAELQARVMLDGAKATYNFFGLETETGEEIPTQPLDAVFFGGYSSGGHAAFAAKDYASDYAPELPVAGIIGHGPTTNVEILLQESPIFSPYLIYAYGAFYGSQVINPQRVFLERWLPTFEEDVTTKCVDEIFQYYGYSARRMYRPEFNDALYTDQLGNLLPAFYKRVTENSTGLSKSGTDIPVLILQGTADTVITPPSQNAFVTQLCQLGNRVTYLVYPAVDHPDIRRVSFRDTINWMESLAAGETPESDCADFVGQ